MVFGALEPDSLILYNLSFLSLASDWLTTHFNWSVRLYSRYIVNKNLENHPPGSITFFLESVISSFFWCFGAYVLYIYIKGRYIYICLSHSIL